MAEYRSLGSYTWSSLGFVVISAIISVMVITASFGYKVLSKTLL